MVGMVLIHLEPNNAEIENSFITVELGLETILLVCFGSSNNFQPLSMRSNKLPQLHFTMFPIRFDNGRSLSQYGQFMVILIIRKECLA